MADFGDFSTNDFNAGDFEVEDPTADFLARERAILGEDADFIASTGDAPAQQTGATQADDSLFDFGETSTSNAQQVPLPASTSSRFQTSLDSNTQFNQFDTNSFSESKSYQAPHSDSQGYQSTPVSGNYSSANYGTAPAPSQGSVFSATEVESEFVRNWRSQFQDRLGDRDRREKEKHQQIITDAQAELKKFREEYESKRKSKIQEKGRVTSNSNDGRDGKSGWDLVQHMISPNSGSLNKGAGFSQSQNATSSSGSASKKDTSRLRSLIQDLAITGESPRIKGH